MVGLNVEMGRELLWRGFPTDQRGTYFDQFWDVRARRAAPGHRSDPRLGRAPLGDAAGAPAREQFVMLMRSALLRRYPNAVIYAAPAIAGERHAHADLDPATSASGVPRLDAARRVVLRLRPHAGRSAAAPTARRATTS